MQRERWSDVYVVSVWIGDLETPSFGTFANAAPYFSGSENSARGVHARAFMRRDVRLDVF